MIEMLESPPRDRDEHSSITIGDLGALVAGIAIVLVLPTRQTYLPHRTDFLGPWPGWLPWCFCLRQVLGASCMALVPVVLRRRASYGGLARPAELLVLFAAMPFLASGIETMMIRLSYRWQHGITLPGLGLEGISMGFYQDWQTGPHWTWEYALLASSALALVVFLTGCHGLSGWLLTAMLALAWLGAYEPGTMLAPAAIYRMITLVAGQRAAAAVALGVWTVAGLFPRFVLYAVPAIAALRYARGEGKGRMSWLERAGLGLAAALFLVAEPTELVRLYWTGGGRIDVDQIVRVAALVVTVIVGVVVNRLWCRRARTAATSW